MNNIETRSQHLLITLPKRGIKVIAPEHTRKVMEMAKQHKINGTRFTDEEKKSLWPDTEKTRIQIIKQCGTLNKRYPSRKEGLKFMESVDYERREELLLKAQELSSEIAKSWQKVNPEEQIAIILFGSVSKGLVKHTDHPDPSNIDLAVMGNISPDEREKLMESIRPHRKSVQQWLLSRVPFINSSESNPGNAGVIVQHSDKVQNDNYEPARNYIASGAIALHDPAGIWANIEHQALLATIEKKNGSGCKKRLRCETVFEAK